MDAHAGIPETHEHEIPFKGLLGCRSFPLSPAGFEGLGPGLSQSRNRDGLFFHGFHCLCRVYNEVREYLPQLALVSHDRRDFEAEIAASTGRAEVAPHAKAGERLIKKSV